jgi:hypothetical protein
LGETTGGESALVRMTRPFRAVAAAAQHDQRPGLVATCGDGYRVVGGEHVGWHHRVRCLVAPAWAPLAPASHPCGDSFPAPVTFRPVAGGAGGPRCALGLTVGCAARAWAGGGEHATVEAAARETTHRPPAGRAGAIDGRDVIPASGTFRPAPGNERPRLGVVDAFMGGACGPGTAAALTGAVRPVHRRPQRRDTRHGRRLQRGRGWRSAGRRGSGRRSSGYGPR